MYYGDCLCTYVMRLLFYELTIRDVLYLSCCRGYPDGRAYDVGKTSSWYDLSDTPLSIICSLLALVESDLIHLKNNFLFISRHSISPALMAMVH